MNFRRWEDGALIGVTDTSPEFTAQYGAPYFVVHRAHLHNAMYEQAVALGVKTRLNSKVDFYDAETGTIVTSDGCYFSGDLIVAADGKFLTHSFLFVSVTTSEPSLSLRGQISSPHPCLAQRTRCTQTDGFCCISGNCGR